MSLAKGKKVSEKTVRRLPRYYRVLKELDAKGLERISSSSLAELLGVVPSQIRQDLCSFGQFGVQGYGYAVRELIDSIEDILGMRRSLSCVLIGAGNIGRALAKNFCFEAYGMELLCAFDLRSPGEIEGYGATEIRHPRELPAFLDAHSVDFAVLAVPRDAAVETAEWLASLGITAIWNFTGMDIGAQLPDVIVENVHFPDSLLFLSYQVSVNPEENKAPGALAGTERSRS